MGINFEFVFKEVIENVILLGGIRDVSNYYLQCHKDMRASRVLLNLLQALEINTTTKVLFLLSPKFDFSASFI